MSEEIYENIVGEIRKTPEFLAQSSYKLENCFNFLNQAEIEFSLKDKIYEAVQREKRVPVLLAQLQAMNLNEHLLGALTEMITAKI